MSNSIELRDVTFGYGSRPVLSNVNLCVERGESLCLLGPSGSGKSSIVRLILGFAVLDAGQVLLDGERATIQQRIVIPPEERNLGIVFQDLALWPHLTVQGNLAFALKAKRIPVDQQQLRIQDILERVGLRGREQHYPGELSGGERQRVAICRALVQEPRAVLLDEPLSNLDAPLKRELMAIFRELFDERKTTVLYVTHDVREAAVLGDRCAVLESGRIVQTGTIAELREQPATPFVRALCEDWD